MIRKFKTEFLWAFIFIAISLLWMLIEKLAGLHSVNIDKHMYLTNLFAIPAILVYILALRNKKINYYSNQISYKQSFLSGLVITIIVTVFSPITQWIITYIITPEYFPNVIQYSVESGYFKSLEEAQDYFNFPNYVKQSLIGALVMGIAATAIVSLFIKSRKPKYDKHIDNN